MRYLLMVRRTCILGLILALGGGGGLAEDMAAVMPADTALYIGWSEWVKPDSPALRLQERLVTAAGRVATRPGAETAPPVWVAPLLELLAPLETGSVGMGLFDLEFEAGMPQFEAALIAAGPEVKRLPDAVHAFFAQVLGAEQIEAHKLRDVSLELVHLPNEQALEWGLHGGYFLLGLGDTATLDIIDTLEQHEPALSTVDEFTFDRRKLSASGDGRHFCIYADVRRAVQRAKEIIGQRLGGLPENIDQILDELGITSIRSKYVQVVEQNGQPRLTAFADIQGPLRGLLALWNQKPLLDEDIRIVPQDAYWAQITNLDLSALWQEAQRVIEVVAPDKTGLLEGPFAVAQRVLGFSIPYELLPALGDTWELFDAPEHGGILLTGTVLVVEVREPGRLEDMLERCVQVLARVAAGRVSVELKQLQYGSHTIHYLLFGGKPVPIAPAWGFVGLRGVFGLSPQTVAAAMRQVDPQTRGSSLLDQPDFQAARPKLPPNIQSIGYCNSRYFMGLAGYGLLNLLETAGISMLAPYGGTIDFGLLPPFPEAMAGVTNYVSATGSDADGILYTSIGSGASLPVVAGAIGLVTSIVSPVIAHAREEAKLSASNANLRNIGHACLVWASEHNGRFPVSLFELVRTGMLTDQALLSPRDPYAALTPAERQKLASLGDLRPTSEPVSGSSYSSYAYISGQTTGSDPGNVLAYERPADDKGTYVLFLDGHVEWLKPEAFKAAVRETYQRLGREKDLPAAFRE